MLELINNLFETLNMNGTTYCHWKSNSGIKDVLNGNTDIDLLIGRESINSFISIISLLGFKKAKSGKEGGICHYFALDNATGKIVHLHVYYRLITGGSLLKNYKLPLDEMLLQNTRYIENVNVPAEAADLAVFVIRKMLEYASIGEIIMQRRESRAVRKELEWLLNEKSVSGAVELLKFWLPAVDRGLFSACVKAMQNNASFFSRILLARRLKSCLGGCRIHNDLEAFFIRNFNLLKKVYSRSRKKKDKELSFGGVVIAIVGPEATGKSTVHSETVTWLGEYLNVKAIHAGKPPSTLLTFIPNGLIPFLRTKLPGFRTSRVNEDIQKMDAEHKAPLTLARKTAFVLRALMVAFDRKVLLNRIFKEAVKGTIVICDRYPTYVSGAMDSSQLSPSLFEGKSKIFQSLVRLENNIYFAVPPPDIVIQLSVPVEIALSRNILRKKKGTEGESYIRRRHAQVGSLRYTTGKVARIDTSGPLDETLLEVKRTIWKWL